MRGLAWLVTLLCVAAGVVSSPGLASAGAQDNEAGALRTLLSAEELLRAGDFSAAAGLSASIAQTSPHGAAAVRVRAWALARLGDHKSVAHVLASEDHTASEVGYLRGVARLRIGETAGGRADLQALWWQQPYGYWGMAALRELAPWAGYAKKEAALIGRYAPNASHNLGEQVAFDGAKALQALARRAPRGKLRAEALRGLGMRRLEQEKFGEALRLFRRAFAATKDAAVRRAITLSLAETQRRRGNIRRAAAYFDAVAAHGDDALSHEALALAGQMFIERRQYKEARRRLQAQLLANPVGPTRHAALWGLGWVAFRNGEFDEARQFFASLTDESPYGPLAPAALYWGARSLEELHQRDSARGELVRITQLFPTDYYALRAATQLGPAPWPMPATRGAKRNALVSRLAASANVSGDAVTAALGDIEESTLQELGPDDLQAVVRIADAHRLPSRAARALLRRRFPQMLERRDRLFPRGYARQVSRAAKRARLAPELVLAVIRQESGFNAHAISPVGALGLMQLMPATAAELLRETGRGATAKPEIILRPATNIRLGTRYLGRMLRAFGGRIEYALASYNAGPGAVTRWRHAQGDVPVDIFVEEIPYAETRDYVRRVLGYVQTQHYLAQKATAVVASRR